MDQNPCVEMVPPLSVERQGLINQVIQELQSVDDAISAAKSALKRQPKDELMLWEPKNVAYLLIPSPFRNKVFGSAKNVSMHQQMNEAFSVACKQVPIMFAVSDALSRQVKWIEEVSSKSVAWAEIKEKVESACEVWGTVVSEVGQLAQPLTNAQQSVKESETCDDFKRIYWANERINSSADEAIRIWVEVKVKIVDLVVSKRELPGLMNGAA
jgi:hypothetical protein